MPPRSTCIRDLLVNTSDGLASEYADRSATQVERVDLKCVSD